MNRHLALDAVISIVDDDESVREATKGLLEARGYSARTFSGAEEFLSSRHLQDTRCLITDVRMPGLNGIELQRLLLDTGHRIPVIFITARQDERTRERALQAGAYGFLSKPFSEEGLMTCLVAALNTVAAGA
jgi:FixJ family two-component response regulator